LVVRVLGVGLGVLLVGKGVRWMWVKVSFMRVRCWYAPLLIC
jgi:hypothetical protein